MLGGELLRHGLRQLLGVHAIAIGRKPELIVQQRRPNDFHAVPLEATGVIDLGIRLASFLESYRSRPNCAMRLSNVQRRSYEARNHKVA